MNGSVFCTVIALLLWPLCAEAQIARRADKALVAVVERLVDGLKGRAKVLALVKVADYRTGRETGDCPLIRLKLDRALGAAARRAGIAVASRDRQELAAVQVAVNFGMSDWVAPHTRQEAGRLLGADALMIGRFVPETKELFLKVLEVETGRELAHESCFVLGLYEGGLSRFQVIMRVSGLVLVLVVFWWTWRRGEAEFRAYPRGIKPGGWVFLVFSLAIELGLAWFWLGKHLW